MKEREATEVSAETSGDGVDAVDEVAVVFVAVVFVAVVSAGRTF